MTPRAKLFLVLAGAGATLALVAGSSKKANAAPAPSPLPPFEPEEEDEEPIARFPEVRLPEAPTDLIPPRIPFDQRDEKDIEEDELTGNTPPFVPPPISNEGPRPQPAPRPAPAPRPPVQLPPELEEVPELLEQIPGFVPPPERQPARTPPAPKPPLASPPEDPDVTVLREDTEDVLSTMLPKERTKDWKRAEPVLKLWQEERGRPVDGKFGPGDAVVMAEETGLLPIIRFWPKGTLIETGVVDDYRTDLLRIARDAEEPRKSQLKAAAEREKGQAFARNPEPINPTIEL